MKQPVTGVTQHAIDRYMERFKTCKVERAISRMLDAAHQGTALGGGRFYWRGVIVVTQGDMVVTAFRPRTVAQKFAVNQACRRKRK